MNHKASVVFAEEVWKKIEWFTYNFDTEIGALGIVKQKKDEDGEKYFYVEELLFPQQKVTGATVHFTPEMWGELIKERGLDGLKNIAFYWHRHPGSSAHSGTDDEDTFETFMSTEAKRKYFIFLQTAIGTAGWNQEARIDIRLPVRHTILDADIDIEVDETEEDEELRKECEAIAEKCIIKMPAKSTALSYYRQGAKNTHTGYSGNKTGWEHFESVVRTNSHGTLQSAIEKGRFGIIEGTDHMNNDMLNGFATAPDEKVSITFEHGQATVVAGKKFGLILEKVMEKKTDGKLSQYVREWKVGKSNTAHLKKYNLQPITKKYLEMKTSLTRGYLVFCDKLLEEIDEDVADANPPIAKDLKAEPQRDIDYSNPTDGDIKALQHLFTGQTYDQIIDLDEIRIKGYDDVKDVLLVLEAECAIDWDNICQATVYDLDYQGVIGSLWRNSSEDELVVSGNTLVWVLKGEEESIALAMARQREEEEAEEEEE